MRKWGTILITSVAIAATTPVHAAENNFVFDLVVSTGAATCLPKAAGRVTIAPAGTVEQMHVEVFGLPKNSEFDFFVIQVPNGHVGLSWYQGDITTDNNGIGVGDFVGRFSIETFNVAPGVAPAPVVFGGPFPDASSNPATNPVQLYHLGLWFGSPTEATAAGCPGTVTPFNGTHTAGIQVLNSSNFPANSGPLLNVQ